MSSFQLSHHRFTPETQYVSACRLANEKGMSHSNAMLVLTAALDKAEPGYIFLQALDKVELLMSWLAPTDAEIADVLCKILQKR